MAELISTGTRLVSVFRWWCGRLTLEVFWLFDEYDGCEWDFGRGGCCSFEFDDHTFCLNGVVGSFGQAFLDPETVSAM